MPGAGLSGKAPTSGTTAPCWLVGSRGGPIFFIAYWGEERDSLNPKYAQPKKSICINLFAQLNPGFGGNNYLLNWGTAPRSLVFIGGFLWGSVVYAALLSGFGVLWWVSVMLVSFLLGFGVFF